MEQKQFYLSGIEQMKLGNYKAAKQIFSEGIERFPENADFYSERGVARFHLNDIDGALQDMNRAADIEPDKPYRYSSRAFIKDALKDVRGAIADYKKALELDPEDDIAHNNLGLLEEKLGYTEMAKQRFKTADRLALSKNGQSHDPKFPQIDEEGERLIASFKEELNLHVVEDQPLNQSKNELKERNTNTLWKTALSVFYSKKARQDYVVFLKNLMKVSG